MLTEIGVSLELYLAYIAACGFVAAIPGPTVTLIVANSLTHGTRAGLLNAAGGQLALAVMMGALIVGLTSIVAALGAWFEWLRLAGAAYLVWLGWKLLKSRNGTAAAGAAQKSYRGFMAQGFLVVLSNPKPLLWFGAFIPQFIDPSANYKAQIVLLGATAMAMGMLSDGAYAMLTGSARHVISARRVRFVSRVGGGFLICGGLWLAFGRPLGRQ